MQIKNKIALRYIFSNKKSSFIGIISLISFIGITLGVATVIIVMAIFQGFQDLHKTKIITLDPHIRIQPKNSKWFDENINTLEILKNLNKQSYIKEIAINSMAKVVLIKDGFILPTVLNSYLDTNIEIFKNLKNNKVMGSFNFYINNDNIPRVIMGANLAHKLNAKIGDTVNIMSAELIERSIKYYTTNNGSIAIISGLYHTNIENYDEMTILSNDLLIKDIFEGNYKFNSFDIRLKNIDMIDNFQKYKDDITILLDKMDNKYIEKLSTNKSLKFNVVSWYDLNSDIFRIMKFERFASFTIVSLIILISSFNIFASLGMSVVEKGRDISILKALGADDRTISSIFKTSGLIIGTSASIFGVILGLGFCYLNLTYKILKIDGQNFIIDYIPMKIIYSEVLFLFMFSILLSYLASIIPSKKAIETNIIEKLKSE